MENWKEKDGKLKAHFEFDDFVEAWAFMTKVAMTAEKMGHHPEWTNEYNTVDISLCTHDEGSSITEKDRKLAAQISDFIK